MDWLSRCVNWTKSRFHNSQTGIKSTWLSVFAAEKQVTGDYVCIKQTAVFHKGAALSSALLSLYKPPCNCTKHPCNYPCLHAQNVVVITQDYQGK